MNSFTEAYKVPQLKKKMWFTVLIISAMMLATLIPIPCLNHQGAVEAVKSWGDVGALLNIVSGRGLYNASVVSLGIYPFLVASILMQIVTIAVPKLRDIAMSGEAGSAFITKITRIASIVMDVVFALLYTLGLKNYVGSSLINFWVGAALVTITVACGAALCGWCIELLNTKGLGNGITLVLLAGIIRSIPHAFVGGSRIQAIVLAVVGIMFIVLSVLANSGEKKLRIIFSKRTVGVKQYGMQNQTIPLRVTQAGIMPIVYTFVLCLLPAMIIAMVNTQSSSAVVSGFTNFKTSASFYIVFVILLVAFTYFFAMIQFNPIDVSNQIKENGGYIQGIKPGKPTSQYLINTYQNMNLADSMYIISMCLIPMFLSIIPTINGVWYLGIACAMLAGGISETGILLDNGVKSAEEKAKQTVKDAKKNKYAK